MKVEFPKQNPANEGLVMVVVRIVVVRVVGKLDIVEIVFVGRPGKLDIVVGKVLFVGYGNRFEAN